MSMCLFGANLVELWATCNLTSVRCYILFNFTAGYLLISCLFPSRDVTRQCQSDQFNTFQYKHNIYLLLILSYSKRIYYLLILLITNTNRWSIYCQ